MREGRERKEEKKEKEEGMDGGKKGWQACKMEQKILWISNSVRNKVTAIL